MQFVNPYILFGLLAISVPVIVHLFNFRRYRKVFFTNVNFIEELKLETQRRSKLKHLIVLFLRILAITFLVMAFAQPYIPVSADKIEKGVSQAVSVYVDNSFSMEAMSENGILFDMARNRAAEIASIYKTSDVFQLLTNDFEGRHQRFVSRDEFNELLGELKISPISRKLSEVVSRQENILSNEKNRIKSAYIISDFQKSISDIENFESDTTVSSYLIPVSANVNNNLYIDSCWFESPAQHLKQRVNLIVRIKNVSDLGFEKIPVKLLINGMQKALASFDIEAHDEVEIKMPYTNTSAGIQYGSLHIIDYPVVYDDIFNFSYKVSASIPILCINGNGESRYLNSLFENDSAFMLKNTTVNNIDYSSFNNFRLIILNELKEISSGFAQELRRFIDNGGNILTIPAKEIELENYKDFLASLNIDAYTTLDTIDTKVTYVDIKHPIYREVFDDIAIDKGRLPDNTDLPKVSVYYKISRVTTSKQEVLMSLENGNPFLSRMPSGKGVVYLLAVSLDEGFSNFASHAIFVPTLYNIALLSDPVGKLYYTIGEFEFMEFRQRQITGDNVFRIKKLNSNFEIIPEHKYFNSMMYFYTYDQLRQAGNYMLMTGSDTISGISINYNRNESNLEVLTSQELKQEIVDSGLKRFTLLEVGEKPLSQAISEMSQGKRLWKLFILLALIMLAGEVLLLRFWR